MFKRIRRMMAGWTCPYCGQYVKEGQSHNCAKGF